jgi:glycosyltransferase involved in cell wall biosynthesis
MKVLFINHTSDRSEVELYLGLKAKGVDISLILDPEDTATEKLRENGIEVTVTKIKNRYDFVFDNLLKKIIKEKNINIIHAPTSRGLASALRVVKGKLYIKLVSYRGTLGHLSRWSLLARQTHLSKRVDAIICNCLAVKSYLVNQGVSEKKLYTIYKGHHVSWYQQGEAYTREDFKIAESAFVVGCIANLRPLKGIDVLVKAISYLKLGRPVVCLLVGENRIAHLTKLIDKLNLNHQIKLLGFRRDISRILPICDVTVMPSVRREGFPRAIVESMSLNVPVICSNIGGMPEIVDDHVNGLVVPANNILALSKALEVMAKDNDFRERAAIACFETVQMKLSVEEYVTKTHNLYLDILKNA